MGRVNFFRYVAIFVYVKLLPRYSKLPLSPALVALSLLVLLMVVWSQGGFTPSIAHLYFLIASYLTWGFMLPFIQGLTDETANYRFQTAVRALLKAIILILIHFILSNSLYYLFQYLFLTTFVPPTLNTLKAIIGPSLMSRFIDFILFFGLLSWVKQSKSLSTKNMQLMKAEAQLQKSRLSTLRSQLNPHFLFNTLHAISSLIGTNDEKARLITVKISSLLRKTLQANEKRTHTLKDELELMEDYLAIEKERFNDRLIIDKQVDPAVYNVVVPTMMLQPLVENAFKHGVALIESQTVFAFKIQLINGQIVVSISNDVAKNENSRPLSTGIGLKNLEERLKLYYQEDCEFSYDVMRGRFQVNLNLPYHEL